MLFRTNCNTNYIKQKEIEFFPAISVYRKLQAGVVHMHKIMSKQMGSSYMLMSVINTNEF
jgi:hypothetical protein